MNWKIHGEVNGTKVTLAWRSETNPVTDPTQKSMDVYWNGSPTGTLMQGVSSNLVPFDFVHLPRHRFFWGPLSSLLGAVGIVACARRKMLRGFTFEPNLWRR